MHRPSVLDTGISTNVFTHKCPQENVRLRWHGDAELHIAYACTRLYSQRHDWDGVAITYELAPLSR
jgi:hypothetical protein